PDGGSRGPPWDTPARGASTRTATHTVAIGRIHLRLECELVPRKSSQLVFMTIPPFPFFTTTPSIKTVQMASRLRQTRAPKRLPSKRPPAFFRHVLAAGVDELGDLVLLEFGDQRVGAFAEFHVHLLRIDREG